MVWTQNMIATVETENIRSTLRVHNFVRKTIKEKAKARPPQLPREPPSSAAGRSFSEVLDSQLDDFERDNVDAPWARRNFSETDTTAARTQSSMASLLNN